MSAAQAVPVSLTPRFLVESLEMRSLLSAAFDVTGLTALRQNPQFTSVDGSGVTVAVLDTGVDVTNPDLQSNVVGFYNAVTDPVDTPGSFDSASSAFDNDGHGTHVSGIVASSDPSIGVAYAAKLVDVRVLPDASDQALTGDPIVRGLRWVALNASEFNIRVVNLSLGVSANINASTDALGRTEIARAIDNLESLGITVVAASGNSYAQYVTPGEAFPAAVSTLSVANTWADQGQAADFNVPFGSDGDRYFAVEQSAGPDRFAATSQRSTLSNQLAAPGQDILSDWLGTSADGSTGAHRLLSGTSMAAPFVSGVVALMQDAAKTFGGRYLSDPGQIARILRQTADTITDANVPDNSRYDSATGQSLPLPETGLTYQRINVENAIAEVFREVTAGNPSAPAGQGNPDTDSIRADATAVPELNATRSFSFTGNIGSDGQIAVGDQDVDLFRIVLQARGNLSAKLSLPDGGAATDTRLRLFNADGTQIDFADGTAAGGYATLTTDSAQPLATGVYYLGVSQSGNSGYEIVTGTGAAGGTGQGDYALSLSLSNPDPNGVVQGAADADLTNPNDVITDPLGTGRKITAFEFRGILGSDRQPDPTLDPIKVDADVDMIRLAAPDDGVIGVKALGHSVYGSLGADTFVQVYDEQLHLIAENDNVSATNRDSFLTAPVKRGGVYYVAVTVFANRGFSASDPYTSRSAGSTAVSKKYDLIIWAENNDINGTALAPTVLPADGSTLTAAIGSDNGNPVGLDVAPSKDVDWYSVTAARDGLLKFAAAGRDGFAPSISLWQVDPLSGQPVKLADGGTTPVLAIQASQGSQYFLSVTGSGNENDNWAAVAGGVGGAVGTYDLTTSLEALSALKPLINDSVDTGTPTPIALGETVTGTLGEDGQVVVGPSDVDLYQFTPTTDVVVRVRTIVGGEDDADTVLRLFDSTGQQLRANDNYDPSAPASRITGTLLAGRTYYIGVSGAGPAALNYDPITGDAADQGSTGRYTLVLDALPPGSVSVAFSEGHPARFTDQTGQPVTISLSGSGSGLLEITGPGVNDFALSLDDTDPSTVVTISGQARLGNISVNGPVGEIAARGSTLAGNLNVEGTLGTLSLSSAAPGSFILANLIGDVRVGGDFGAAIAVSGDMGTFRADGNLVGATWQIAGGIQSIAAKDVSSLWIGEFGGDVSQTNFRTYSGRIVAAQVDAFAASDIVGGILRTTAGGINAINVGGMNGANIRTIGDIGSVTVNRGMIGTTLFAGVSDDVATLPTAASTLDGSSSIGSIYIGAGPFSNCIIAASQINMANLRGTLTINGGIPFGLATRDLRALKFDGKLVYRAGVGDLHTADDFAIRLFPD